MVSRDELRAIALERSKKRLIKTIKDNEQNSIDDPGAVRLGARDKFRGERTAIFLNNGKASNTIITFNTDPPNDTFIRGALGLNYVSLDYTSVFYREAEIVPSEDYIKKLPEEPFPVDVQILYFVWDDGYFNWYVGGDREIPLLIHREPDESTFPPPAINVRGGVDYSEYEITSLTNKNKQLFNAIISKGYSDPPYIYMENSFQFTPGTPPVWNSVENLIRNRPYLQGYSNSGSNYVDYNYGLTARTVIDKNLRGLGGGYSFGSVILIQRLFFRTGFTDAFDISAPQYQGNPKPYFLSEDGLKITSFTKYVDIPEEYLGKIYYLEPTPEGGSREVVVQANLSSSGDSYSYTYSLPVSASGGALPLRNPVCSYAGNSNTYTYEGESYLNIANDGKSCITEYLRKDSPTEVYREIRFYKNKKFIKKLNIADSDLFLDTTQFSTLLNLSIYSTGAVIERRVRNTNASSLSGFQTSYPAGTKGKLYSATGETREAYMVEFEILSFSTSGSINPSDVNLKVQIRLLTDPVNIGFSSYTTFIYSIANYNAFVFSSGSYMDWLSTSTDINRSVNFGNELTAYSSMPEFHPFSTTDPNYTHYGLAERTFNFIVPLQQRLYGNYINRFDYRGRAIEHISDFVYLDNNFSCLYYNKLYRITILYQYDGYVDVAVDSSQEPSTDVNEIRGVTSIDPRAICYVEQWDINENNGKVTKNKKIWKLPVYGLYTPDINWYYSLIQDIDIGFNK